MPASVGNSEDRFAHDTAEFDTPVTKIKVFVSVSKVQPVMY